MLYKSYIYYIGTNTQLINQIDFSFRTVADSYQFQSFMPVTKRLSHNLFFGSNRVYQRMN